MKSTIQLIVEGTPDEIRHAKHLLTWCTPIGTREETAETFDFKKIAAVKEIRKAHSLTLFEAKQIVDSVFLHSRINEFQTKFQNG